jgi:hypothetical protein
MRRLLLWIVPLALGALCASSAHAQACLGLPSFEAGAIRLNVAGEFPDSATAYAIGIGAGKPDGPFGTLGAGRVSFVGIEEKATLGFVELGYQLPLGRLQACPVVGGSLAAGPDDEAARLTVTSRGAVVGGALGLPVSAGAVTVIPNLAVRYEYLSQEVDEEGIGSETYTFDSTILDLGLALVLMDRLSVQPLAHVPLRGDDRRTSFGVFASVAFGLPGR